MAQPTQGAGQQQGIQEAPKTNKTIKDFVGQNTQNERNALDEGSFHWLENIQPIGKGNLHSIPGRGPSLILVPPAPPPPPGCTDTTLRGQQIISIEDRFIQPYNGSPIGNLRTSWGFIDSTEQVYTLIGDGTCGGGNMSYSDTSIGGCCEINHFINHTTPITLPLILPDSTRNALNARVGSSDQPVYMYNSNSVGGAGCAFYFPLLGTETDCLMPSGVGYSGFEVFGFAIKGNSIWLVTVNQASFSPNRELLEYNRTTGALLNRYTTLTGFTQNCPQLTANFLYVVCADLGTGLASVKKINRSDGTLAGTFFIDNIGGNMIGVVNDNLIYVLSSGNPAALYYISNFSTITFVGYTPGQGFSPFFANGFFNGGAFYYGSSGFAGFPVDIFKINVACPAGSPPTPIIASLARGSSSVVHGGSINVTWSDVLTPTVNDVIYLRAAPAAGHIGFVGPVVASQVASGLGSGTISFTIPGGTTPGSYIFQYVAENAVWVCNSPSFTVT